MKRKSGKRILTLALVLCLALGGGLHGAAQSTQHHDAAASLYQQNDDTVGWLRVPGTDIDEVVVQEHGKNNDNTYYLRRDFNEDYSFAGSYFADYRCVFQPELSTNTAIFGNSLSGDPDGQRFAQLLRYKDDAFAAANPHIYFATTTETLTWEVFAVSILDIQVPFNRPDPDATDFTLLLDTVRDKSLRPYSQIAVGQGDKILTLITEDYTMGPFPNDFRFVIMAKLVDGGAVSAGAATGTATAQDSGASSSANSVPATGR